MRISSTDALLVIDVQNDFCPGGALAVADGHRVVDPINALLAHFSCAVFTQDWHPADHQSFSSQHAGMDPFAMVQMPYGSQTLWPDHCIQQSNGAAFHAQLRTDMASLILRKGGRAAIDSYSAFCENDRTTSTGLAGFLTELGIQRVFCCGLAYDYCVRYSAEDARARGFETVVITDACRAIDLQGSAAETSAALQALGILQIEADAILAGS